ncbi:MAG TPA: hypothetical protein VGI74_17280 [Streptosporangiaceae bacterium]|jgi:hypothetical protein
MSSLKRLAVPAGVVEARPGYRYAKLGAHSRRELRLYGIDPPSGPGVA